MSIRTPLSLVAAAALLLACDRDSTPQKPQLFVDRDFMGFGLEFDTAVYIGTSRQESLTIENQGLETLVIEGVDQTGDAEFVLTGPQETSVTGKKHTFLQVTFTPTQAKDYTGKLTIRSNAENTPVQEIELGGQGVTPPPP